MEQKLLRGDNRKLETLPEILNQTTEFAAKRLLMLAGCIKCRTQCFQIFLSTSSAHKKSLKSASVLQGNRQVEDNEYQEEFISKTDLFLLMLHRGLGYV